MNKIIIKLRKIHLKYLPFEFIILIESMYRRKIIKLERESIMEIDFCSQFQSSISSRRIGSRIF